MATIIFTIALGALLSSLIAIVFLVDITKEQTVAVNDLINVMERIRATPFENLLALFPDGVTDGPAANPYDDILGNYTLKGEHVVARYVNAAADPLEIKLTLSWLDKFDRPYNISIATFKTR